MKHTRTAFIFIFLAFSQTLFGQTVADLYRQNQELAKKYLIKNVDLNHFFGVDAAGIATYASESSKKANRPECRIYWDELEDFKKLILTMERKELLKTYLNKKDQRFDGEEKQKIRKLWVRKASNLGTPQQPLLGKRIALDPGHVAGDMDVAKIEGRFIEMAIDSQKVSFCEGDLALSTAKLIKERLEKYGANVLISRPNPNAGADGRLLKTWIKEDLPTILQDEVRNKKITYAERKKLLNFPAKAHNLYFVDKDLEKRAEKINEFQPDLTLVLHFNADALKKDSDWNKATKENYNMVFVAGAFLKHELDEPSERFDFLRLMLLENLEKSIRLSQMVITELTNELQVPVVPRNNEIPYLSNSSIYVSEGVYARNLGLCRLINSPLCYGETLYQDNAKEALLLNQNDSKNGKPAPRIVQIADAYSQAVLQYFENGK